MTVGCTQGCERRRKLRINPETVYGNNPETVYGLTRRGLRKISGEGLRKFSVDRYGFYGSGPETSPETRRRPLRIRTGDLSRFGPYTVPDLGCRPLRIGSGRAVWTSAEQTGAVVVLLHKCTQHMLALTGGEQDSASACGPSVTAPVQRSSRLPNMCCSAPAYYIHRCRALMLLSTCACGRSALGRGAIQYFSLRAHLATPPFLAMGVPKAYNLATDH
jgi:hypothetical protein